jgi:hypothetical protein
MLEMNEVADSTYLEWGDKDRFFGGIALVKASKAQKLVFTGGKMPWDKAKKTESEVLKVHIPLKLSHYSAETEPLFVDGDLTFRRN